MNLITKLPSSMNQPLSYQKLLALLICLNLLSSCTQKGVPGPSSLDVYTTEDTSTTMRKDGKIESVPGIEFDEKDRLKYDIPDHVFLGMRNRLESQWLIAEINSSRSFFNFKKANSSELSLHGVKIRILDELEDVFEDYQGELEEGSRTASFPVKKDDLLLKIYKMNLIFKWKIKTSDVFHMYSVPMKETLHFAAISSRSGDTFKVGRLIKHLGDRPYRRSLRTLYEDLAQVIYNSPGQAISHYFYVNESHLSDLKLKKSSMAAMLQKNVFSPSCKLFYVEKNLGNYAEQCNFYHSNNDELSDLVDAFSEEPPSETPNINSRVVDWIKRFPIESCSFSEKDENFSSTNGPSNFSKTSHTGHKLYISVPQKVLDVPGIVEIGSVLSVYQTVSSGGEHSSKAYRLKSPRAVVGAVKPYEYCSKVGAPDMGCLELHYFPSLPKNTHKNVKNRCSSINSGRYFVSLISDSYVRL